MRSNWTPSIVPTEDDQMVYLVADDFRKIGRAWREAEYEATDLETVIQDLLPANIPAPSAWLPSTLPSDGRRMFPKM
jgi:hypothetical protein